MEARPSSRLVRVLWALAGATLVVLLLKSFVADAYRVKSSSMRPTIFGGPARPGEPAFDEWVLVRYGRGQVPERFDLVVLRAPEGGDPLVKRVVGLPSDGSLQIRGGDLYIDGRLLPPDAARPALIPVFDDRTLPVADSFEFHRGREGEPSPWREEAGAWWVDARSLAADDGAGRMHYHHDLDDGYLDQNGQRVDGWREVNDGALELEFRFEAAGADAGLRFYLVEEGDTFEVELEDLAAATSRVRLTRRNPRNLAPPRAPDENGQLPPLAGRIEPEVLAEAPVNLDPDRWYRLTFSNVDDTLRLEIPGADLRLSCTYDGNEPLPGRTPSGSKSLGPRVGFGAGGTRAGFRHIRVLRDIYYIASGDFGVERPIDLGPGDLFVLGDNSAPSTDSRVFGPLTLDHVLGTPVAVVWPRLRRLEPTAPTP